MSIKANLIANRPDEKGGLIAQRGFTYQNDWAIKELIELHKGDENYAMIIEYQDDVQIINDVNSPTNISIFQLKTTTAHRFKLGKLILGGPDKKSILTKLYKNILRNKDYVLKAAIVSNARFDCELADSSFTSDSLLRIPLSNLKDSEVDKICKKVDSQLKTEPFRNHINKVSLLVGDMPLDHTESVVVNKLVKYFESQGTSSLPRKVTPFLDALRSEVLRKTLYPYEVSSYNELIQVKSITRNDMNRMLSIELPSNNIDKAFLEVIIQRLALEGADLNFERMIRTNFRQYKVDKITSNNAPFERITFVIESIVNDVLSSTSTSSLINLSNLVLARIGNKYGFDDEYLRTIIICKFIEDE